jgi:ADP-dependent NAD(P)H-hydrate dehydratase / NAD(P)H-hydrate epimerase
MMKIFPCEQIKDIDKYTILHEPIASIDLMERASLQLFLWITAKFSRSYRLLVFVGPGNNGGDGLALARMLAVARYSVDLYYVKFTENVSEDWTKNQKRLLDETPVKLNIISDISKFPVIHVGDIIIDAVFGSGLSRPVTGLPGEVIKGINNVDATVISVDMPSGLFGEDNSKNIMGNVVKADYTLSLQFPKLSYLFAENSFYVGNWEVLPIGLHENAIRSTNSIYSLIENDYVVSKLISRNKFDHKGIYGHGLLVSGSLGKLGAAVLSAGAALRTGIGLLTCHLPICGSIIMQSSLPEAMVKTDSCKEYISDIGNIDSYKAVGIGPGMGTEERSQIALQNLLSICSKPLVIDADALNVLSLHKKWLSMLPAGTILTPHPKEFERLAGKTVNSFDRLIKQIEFSKKYNCIVVLKGAYSSITTAKGNVIFNNTGNPGMATAGSGDVLTGIILSLLAQGYEPENAAVIGVYIHGLAGDIAAEESCYESIIATDIINCIGKAFNTTREPKF